MWCKLPFSDTESCCCAAFKQIIFAGVTIILQYRKFFFAEHNNFKLQIKLIVEISMSDPVKNFSNLNSTSTLGIQFIPV
jgi:hypothetical protein